MRVAIIIAVILLGLVWSCSSNGARAEGAAVLGVGLGGIGPGGYVLHLATNKATKKDAEMAAFGPCHQSRSPEARNCRIIATFSKRCFAAAGDVESGQPGFGWAVENTVAAARKSALEKCKKTAREGREQFCVVEANGCDRGAPWW